MSWKELFGLENLDINEFDLIKKIREARLRNQIEIEVVLKNGERVKIQLKKTKDEGVLSTSGWSW